MKEPANCAVVIVAGGSGTRMGRPKQNLPVCGAPMIYHVLRTFSKITAVTEIVVVSGAENLALWKDELVKYNVKTACGGATRLESVRNGIAAVSPKADVIAVHDAARPLVRAETAWKCMTEAFEHGASVAAIPVKDTVKLADENGETVAETLDRPRLWAAQTPQCYRADIIRAALKNHADIKDATDESQLVEKDGVAVRLVRSDYRNIKVTTPEDITIAEALMTGNSNNKTICTGLGFDTHRMVEGKPLIIGGATIPHNKGLLGHSDGDIVLHAVCDAALGAIAAGEIGLYFPPTDLTIMGISSRVIAEKTIAILKEKGAAVIRMDVTLVAEEPKIVPHYLKVRKSLAEIFGLDINCVSFKAKSAEGIGAVGKGGAMACYALVTVSQQ